MIANSCGGIVNRDGAGVQSVGSVSEAEGVDLGNGDVGHAGDQRIGRADLMAALAAALDAQNDAQLVAISLQLGGRDFLVPFFDVAGLQNGTQPFGKRGITKQRTDGFGEAEDLFRGNLACSVRTELAAHASATLLAEEATHPVAIVGDSDDTEGGTEFGGVSGEKGCVRVAEGLGIGCELFDGDSRLFNLIVGQIMGFVSHGSPFLAGGPTGLIVPLG